VKNRKGHLHGSLENENGGFEERLKMKERLVPSCRPKTRGHLTLPLIIYKIVIMSCKITKMPLWASNVGPFTLLAWK